MNITLNQKNLIELAEIAKSLGFTYLSSRILYQSEQIKFNEIPIEDLHFLKDKNILSNMSVQKKIISYFIEHKKTNIAEYYEKNLLNNCWDNIVLNTYSRLISNNLYYPENDLNLLKIIKVHKSGSKNCLTCFVNLAQSCKNDEISLEIFSLILTEKINKDISLLELEKIQKIFNKRFKNINIELLSEKNSNIINSIFNTVKNKSEDLINLEHGFFLKLNLNTDRLSQSNKLSLNKNTDQISYFFNFFKNFSKTDICLEILSLKEFAFSTGKISKFTFLYEDSSKKNMLYSFACDLIELATKKENNFFLLNINEKNKLLSSLLNNCYLQHSLKEKNIELNQKSKNKI